MLPAEIYILKTTIAIFIYAYFYRATCQICSTYDFAKKKSVTFFILHVFYFQVRINGKICTKPSRSSHQNRNENLG